MKLMTDFQIVLIILDHQVLIFAQFFVIWDPKGTHGHSSVEHALCCGSSPELGPFWSSRS